MFTKQITTTLSDDDAGRLEELSRRTGLAKEELVARGLGEYLSRVEQALAFDGVGFGIWKGREEMKDPAGWVSKLREQTWHS